MGLTGFVFRTIKEYQGNGALIALYLAAVAFLYAKEKTFWKRLALVTFPICGLLLYVCPLTAWIYVRLLDPGTYYRLLWLLPMGVTVAYAGIRLSEKHFLAGVALSAALIILCGRSVYENPYMTPAENAYHLPQTAIDICDAILPENGDPVCAVFPDELLHYVRQYSSRILMPYGREMLVDGWSADNPFYRLMQEGGMETGELSVTAKGYNCNYIILRREQEFQEPMEAYGYRIVAEIDGYYVYRDTTVTWPR